MTSCRYDAAAALVRKFLEAFGNVRRLQVQDLAFYSGRNIKEGWDVDLTPEARVGVPIRILLANGFPYARPLVAVDQHYFMAWPHVEEDGVLCALSDSATISPFDPVGVLQVVLAEAIALIETNRTGENVDDFRQEFLSYWNRSKSSGGKPVLSLIDNISPSRNISIWNGKNFLIVADNDINIEMWLRRRFPRTKKKWTFSRAILVDLPAAPLPADYPKKAIQFAKMVIEQRPEAEKLLSSLLAREELPLVVLTAPTQNGPALMAVRLSRPMVNGIAGRRVDATKNGFRAEKISSRLQMQRFIQAASAPEQLEVKRLDAAWIHGRGRNPKAVEFANKKVVILGIGSIGGFVAEHLAAAGVGDLTLIDHETMVFANAGRHILGVDSEGLPKAPAVADLLQKRFPHHAISGRQIKAEAFLHEEAEKIADYDLVISLTGDWQADSFLNDLYLRARHPPRAVMFGWAEAHAVAGHAVVLSGRNGCLLCHVSDTGLPDLRVAQWRETTTLNEPVCGGIFQPYGPVEISSVNAMIASLLLEFLLGKVSGNAHHIYASDEVSIKEVAGEVTPDWQQRRGSIPDNAKVTLSFGWARRIDCGQCRVDDAD